MGSGAALGIGVLLPGSQVTLVACGKRHWYLPLESPSGPDAGDGLLQEDFRARGCLPGPVPIAGFQGLVLDVGERRELPCRRSPENPRTPWDRERDGFN